MKTKNIFTKTAIIAGLMCSFSALSEMVAITNTTVYTGTDDGVLTNVNVVIEDGKVVAFNPPSLEVDRTVDGQGRILTSGFIASMNRIGLVEVSAVATSRDGKPKKGGAGFDASMAFNPESSLIPFARKGGITQAVVSPRKSDDIFAGQTFNVDLTSEFDSIVATNTSVVANFGGESKQSRAVTLNALKTRLTGRVNHTKSDKKEPSADDQALDKLLAKEVPLVAYAARASDILHLINMKKQFDFNLIIANGNGAVKVKSELAAANVPVILGGLDNLPSNFDTLDSSLSNAGILEKSGVKVIFSIADSHMIKNLRYEAGSAIANGMSVQGALAAVTKNVADAFGIEGGTVEVGAPANLVLWSGDPFEISSKVAVLWINGKEMSTESRQDKLRDRYTSSSSKRAGYIK